MVAVVLDAKGVTDPPVTLQCLQEAVSGWWNMVQGVVNPFGRSLLIVLDTGCLFGKVN